LIRTRYDECKDTTRTGSSAPQGKTKIDAVQPWEWVGDNLQNLPKKGGFRECLRARPGHVFVIRDWSGAELVTNAQNQLDVLGPNPLADALRSGINPHTKIACTWLGIRYEDYDKKNPVHVEHRDLGKGWNFGRWGAMGNLRFQEILREDLGLEWSIEKIRDYNVPWKAEWQADRYFDWVKSQPCSQKLTKDGGLMPVYTMRHWRTGFTKGGCSYTEACNFPFQHLAAAGAGTALWRSWLAGIPQVLFVHDEIVAEVPKADAERVAAELDRIMIESFAVWCPDVPISVEGSIAERYGKG
jgi:hypothetical protein